jgi:hypothetical protein
LKFQAWTRVARLVEAEASRQATQGDGLPDLSKLPPRRFSSIVKTMEVHLPPDMERKINDLAAQSGRGTDDIFQDAVAGYLIEQAQTREMLDGRYTI